MDPVTMAFYATVCGLLSLAGPRLGGAVGRLLVGALVGLAAAVLLPPLRQVAGV